MLSIPKPFLDSSAAAQIPTRCVLTVKTPTLLRVAQLLRSGFKCVQGHKHTARLLQWKEAFPGLMNEFERAVTL